MPRTAHPEPEALNHDSFLDIVANMVGIMIILVLLTGMRIKNAPVPAAIPNAADAKEIEQERATERSLSDEVFGLAEQIRGVEQEALLRSRQRDALAVVVSALEHKIKTRREQMDAASQGKFDLTIRLAQSRVQLEQLERQRVQTETARAEPIVVQNYPTPLSQTVHGSEAHFQLLAGRVVFIPLDELVLRLKESALRQRNKLLELPEVTETVGPRGGFRLKYTLQRHDVTPEVAMETGRGGAYARLEKWTLIPVSGQLGEPLDAALADGSEFRHAISTLRPGRDTITIWTYPDSFAEFRRLKQELYQLGFAVAARPLPEGVPISGSPDGTKSAAQ